MGHYDDYYGQDYDADRCRYRKNAAIKWAEIEPLLAQLTETCGSTRHSSRLTKAVNEFREQTILWRYEEELLEDSDLVLERLSED